MATIIVNAALNCVFHFKWDFSLVIPCDSYINDAATRTFKWIFFSTDSEFAAFEFAIGEKRTRKAQKELTKKMNPSKGISMCDLDVWYGFFGWCHSHVQSYLLKISVTHMNRNSCKWSKSASHFRAFEFRWHSKKSFDDTRLLTTARFLANEPLHQNKCVQINAHVKHTTDNRYG